MEFHVTYIYMYMIHVTLSVCSKAHSHRCNWTELNYFRTANCQFSSVQRRQWQWAFMWAGSATNKTCRRPRLLMTLSIGPPACSGQWGPSWWMNTKFRQWGIWARRLVNRWKNANFTYPIADDTIWISTRSWTSEKQSVWAIIWHSLCDPTISNFDTIPVCDGRTDR